MHFRLLLDLYTANPKTRQFLVGHLHANVFQGDEMMLINLFRRVCGLTFVFDYPGEVVTVQTKRFLLEVCFSILIFDFTI